MSIGASHTGRNSGSSHAHSPSRVAGMRTGQELFGWLIAA